MGDRANVVILDGVHTPDHEQEWMRGDPHEAVFLYTHWAGRELPNTLRAALDRGKGRWNDSTYLARIIFNEMTRGSEFDETGYGISTRLTDNNHPLLVVDVGRQVVIEYPEQKYVDYGFVKLKEHRGQSFEEYKGTWARKR